MSNEFTAVWENNPDTPLNAENLSKFIDNYSEGSILFKDTDGFVGSSFGDDKLKIRANSKVSMKIPVTNAFFDFNDSLISHDSKYIPEAYSNISFRIESPSESKSIALETDTSNLVSNPSFENDLTDWTVELANPGTTSSTVQSIVGSTVYGSKYAEIYIDSSANEARINQTIDLINHTSPVSCSLYYKNSGNLEIIIEGNPDTGSIYWSPDIGWIGTPSQITLPQSTEWTRFEIKNITTTQLTPTDTKIKIHIFSSDASTTHNIDGIQVETKIFCSSFTDSTRLDTNLNLSLDTIRLDEGSADLHVMPKLWSAGQNYLFVMRTSNPSIDAMRLYFDAQTFKLVFSLYDNNLAVEKVVEITYSTEDFSNLLDEWVRIICVWNKDEGLKLYAGTESESNAGAYTPLGVADKSDFQIGKREDTSFFEGLLDNLKFNLFSKSDDQIQIDLSNPIIPDLNIYKIFENINKNLVLDPSLLDSSTEFQAATNYYVWLCSSGIQADTATIKISQDATEPVGELNYFSRIIGGFKTDSSASALVDSLWDIRSIETKTIHAERLLIHGKDSNQNYIEFRTTPYGDENDAQFNVVTRFTDHVYANTGASDFLDIDSSAGTVDIDNLHFDDSTITTNDSVDLFLTAYSGQNIVITSTNIDLSSQGSGTIQLDDLRIKTNKIYSKSSEDLLIENDQSGTDIIITAVGGSIKINSDLLINTSGILKFGDDLQQKIDLKQSDSMYGIGLQTDSFYVRTNDHISFYRQGTHNNAKYDAGGGALMAAITWNDDPGVAIDSNARFYAGKIYDVIHNDLAECWEKGIQEEGQEINYGDVIVRTHDGVKKSQKRAERATIGVASNSFGYILGTEGYKDNLKDSKKIPIAISGRVKVKIIGSVRIGDELVSYKNGYSIKANLFERIFKRNRIIGQVDSLLTDKIILIKVK